MTDMTDEQLKQMNRNTKNIAVIRNAMRNVEKDIEEIKDNHLVHIQADLKDLSTNISAEIKELCGKVDILEKTASERKPLASLGTKVLELIVESIIIGVLVLVGLGKV